MKKSGLILQQQWFFYWFICRMIEVDVEKSVISGKTESCQNTKFYYRLCQRIADLISDQPGFPVPDKKGIFMKVILFF